MITFDVNGQMAPVHDKKPAGALSDGLRRMFEWYKSMVDESTGRLLYLYENGVTVGDGEPIRDIASIWDVEVLSAFLGRDDRGSAEFRGRRFGVVLSANSVGRLLAQLGITCQKPLHRAHECDEALVEQWLKTDYPKIKALAQREKAETTTRSSQQPYAIAMKDRSPFGIAGIWENWKNQEGEWVRTFAILTTPANELVSTIHDRMPAILAPAAYDRWLGAEPDPRDLLQPFPSELLAMWPISIRVNSPSNDDEHLLDEIELAKEWRAGAG